MQVRILMAGLPRANVQVELFERTFGTIDEAKISLYQTNDDGIATFPVTAGQEYMVDNVALLQLEPEVDGNPVWHSLWANLTFAVPSD